ncbi:MAG: HD domain-containing protein [Desulfobacterales bacterium]|jgi:hypothetical protein
MNKDSLPEDGVVSVNDAAVAFGKIRPIAALLMDDSGMNAFVRAFDDTRALFAGRYPGYRAANTKYHDYAHTVSVVVATARLMHGCLADGVTFSSRNGLLTLTAALFHDVGLIQTEEDRNGSGAKYTVGHEERSVRFLREYLASQGFSDPEIEVGANFIRCTILSISPAQISFLSREENTCGRILGSADLLAQMADRLYLEKLLFLFREFEEARLPGFDTELELLWKTKDFYESVAKKRLNEDLGKIHTHMRSHFREWMDIDADLYTEAIAKNIDYLETIIKYCRNSFDCYLEFLRRGGIADQVRKERSEK